MPDVAATEPVARIARERALERDRSRNALASLLVIGLVAGAAVGSVLRQRLAPRPTATECAALIVRYVEHESEARDPRFRANALQARLLSLGGRPALERQQRSCEQGLGAHQVECALRSPTVDELERCLQ